MKWKLTRLEDKQVKEGNTVGWLEFDEFDRGKEMHDTPQMGTSCILDHKGINYTWMTTNIREILKETDDFVHFKTKNSEYVLEKI